MVKFNSIEDFRKDKIEVESKINQLLIEFYKKYEGTVASFVFDNESNVIYQTFKENKMPLVLTASPDISHFKDGFK